MFKNREPAEVFLVGREQLEQRLVHSNWRDDFLSLEEMTKLASAIQSLVNSLQRTFTVVISHRKL